MGKKCHLKSLKFHTFLESRRKDRVLGKLEHASTQRDRDMSKHVHVFTLQLFLKCLNFDTFPETYLVINYDLLVELQLRIDVVINDH